MKITQQRNNDRNTTLSTMSIGRGVPVSVHSTMWWSVQDKGSILVTCTGNLHGSVIC